MADVQIELGFTYAQAASIAPMVEARVREMGKHPKVVAALEAHGIESVEDLTPKQQARVLIKMTLLRWAQQFERDLLALEVDEAAAGIEAAFAVEVE